MLSHAIHKPRGLRALSSHRVRSGPSAIKKHAPRKLAQGMKYSKDRYAKRGR